jgi:hypothetical protein
MPPILISCGAWPSSTADHAAGVATTRADGPGQGSSLLPYRSGTEDQRRFVAHVRGALADDIERGEPLQPVRLRERTKEAKDRTPLSRE